MAIAIADILYCEYTRQQMEVESDFSSEAAAREQTRSFWALH